ncbi:lipopolysaccharide biosynthesis protein [Longimicrobium sp.]|uniref:lipopolysaccharide biosynthesis protein n=1 Tax=Longimicrobium sp. TaxID=2029185 RepID=UPI002F91DE8E
MSLPAGPGAVAVKGGEGRRAAPARGAGAPEGAGGPGGGMRRNALHSLALKLGYTALTIGTAALMARLMGPDGYGVYAFVFAGASLLAMPLQLGVPTLVVRETSAYEAQGRWDLVRGLFRRADGGLLAFGVALAVAALAALPFIPETPGSGMRQTVLWSLLLVPAVALGNTRGAALRGLHAVGAGLLPEQLIRPAAFLLLAAAAALLVPGGLTAPVATASHVAAALVALAAASWMLRRRLPAAYHSAAPAYDDRGWLRSVGPLSLLAGVQACIQHFDVFVLGLFASVDDVALYRVALQGATLVAFTLNATNVALGPQIARSYTRGDMDGLQRLLTRTSRVALATALVPVAIFALAGRELLSAVFGAGYAPAYTALVIVAVGELANVAAGSVGLALNMTGHERDALRGLGAAAAINVALNLLLIPRFGMQGAAVAMALGLVAWNVLLSVFLYRRTGLVAFAFAPRALLRHRPRAVAAPTDFPQEP